MQLCNGDFVIQQNHLMRQEDINWHKEFCTCRSANLIICKQAPTWCKRSFEECHTVLWYVGNCRTNFPPKQASMFGGTIHKNFKNFTPIASWQ